MEEFIANKGDMKSVEKTDFEDTPEENKVCHFLSESGIFLYIKPEDKTYPKVPPPTPKELISDCYVTILPKFPESLKEIELPFVRECGIRDSISMLAKYFNCEDYRNNLVQFWFLDVLVDCIWRAQDEFKFSIQHQKIILEWILFVINLVTSRSMTKNLMFQIFDEALTIAEDYVQSGGNKPPTPNLLFTLQVKDNNEDPDVSLKGIKSVESMTEKQSEDIKLTASQQYIVIKNEEDIQMFRLPNKEYAVVDCLSSSIDPPTEDGFEVGDQADSITKDITDSESSVEFYKPNMSTPPRFKSLSDLKVSQQFSETILQENDEKQSKTIGDWINIPRKQTTQYCPSQIVTLSNKDLIQEYPHNNDLRKPKEEEISSGIDENSENLEKVVLNKEEIFKAFYEYHIWQLKNEYMTDPKKGWTPSLHSAHKGVKSNQNFPKKDRKSLEIPKKGDKTKTSQLERNIFINLCALMAVKQIVFEYFDYNFSFELVRLSLKIPQYLITQDINTNWFIPKEIKGDIKKPMPKKPKKEKVKKEKKSKSSKKDKSSKKSKSTKGSKTKGKDKKKKDKKSKSDKKSKTSKKSDKSKKIK